MKDIGEVDVDGGSNDKESLRSPFETQLDGSGDFVCYRVYKIKAFKPSVVRLVE